MPDSFAWHGEDTEDTALVSFLSAYLSFALNRFLSCSGQPGPFATFSLLRRGHPADGTPLNTHLVLLLKRQQLTPAPALRGLTLKLAGATGRSLLALLTGTHCSPGGMRLNTVQGLALLSGGLLHAPELQVEAVIIISLTDTYIAALTMSLITVCVCIYICAHLYVHTCAYVCLWTCSEHFTNINVFYPPNNPFYR